MFLLTKTTVATATITRSQRQADRKMPPSVRECIRSSRVRARLKCTIRCMHRMAHHPSMPAPLRQPGVRLRRAYFRIFVLTSSRLFCRVLH